MCPASSSAWMAACLAGVRSATRWSVGQAILTAARPERVRPRLRAPPGPGHASQHDTPPGSRYTSRKTARKNREHGSTRCHTPGTSRQWWCSNRRIELSRYSRPPTAPRVPRRPGQTAATTSSAGRQVLPQPRTGQLPKLPGRPRSSLNVHTPQNLSQSPSSWTKPLRTNPEERPTRPNWPATTLRSRVNSSEERPKSCPGRSAWGSSPQPNQRPQARQRGAPPARAPLSP